MASSHRHGVRTLLGRCHCVHESVRPPFYRVRRRPRGSCQVCCQRARGGQLGARRAEPRLGREGRTGRGGGYEVRAARASQGADILWGKPEHGWAAPGGGRTLMHRGCTQDSSLAAQALHPADW
jgi:hypothetical protein